MVGIDDGLHGIIREQGIIINNTGVPMTKTTSKFKHDSLAQALVAAQGNIGAAKKNTVNPHFRSKFADLGSVIEAVKQACNDEGISIIQPLGFLTCHAQGDKPVIVQYLDTVLIHESGGRLEGRVLLPTLGDIQKQCAAITYMRRFGLQSLLLLPAEDADAEDITDRGVVTVAPPKPKGPDKPKPAFLKGK